MKKTIFILTLGLFSLINLYGQKIGAIVADERSREPISDVFVFFDNSSEGVITGKNGKFRIDLAGYKNVTLVFSHLNYELLPFSEIQNLPDTIFLVPQNVMLEEAVVVDKTKPRRFRSRWLKRFKAEFLGADYDKKLIKLKNPEVLLFGEEHGTLTAKTNEPLLIENKVLGYELSFFLENYQSYKDGDLLFNGRVFFKELEGTKKQQAKYNRNRFKIYQKSSRKFFADLVQHNLKGNNYELGYTIFNPKGEISNFEPLEVDSLKIEEVRKEVYEISINRILTVTNNQLKIQQAKRRETGVLGGGIDDFKQTENNLPRSYLWSKHGRIVVNKYGAILNAKEVEEAGYWASLRVATLLPIGKINKAKKNRRL